MVKLFFFYPLFLLLVPEGFGLDHGVYLRVIVIRISGTKPCHCAQGLIWCLCQQLHDGREKSLREKFSKTKGAAKRRGEHHRIIQLIDRVCIPINFTMYQARRSRNIIGLTTSCQIFSHVALSFINS